MAEIKRHLRSYIRVGVAVSASILIAACGGGSGEEGGGDSAHVNVPQADTLAQMAYIKASNRGMGHQYGTAVAVSADGNTMVVGAPRENGATTRINDLGSTKKATGRGAAYVMVRDASGEWSQQAYIKPYTLDSFASMSFGTTAALSDDGHTLVVGMPEDHFGAAGGVVDPSQIVEGARKVTGSGAIYVFQRRQGVWSQHAYIKEDMPTDKANFGHRVAISGDGNTLLAVSPQQSKVYVYTREVFPSGSTWKSAGTLETTFVRNQQSFGTGLSINRDGTMIAVSVPNENSDSKGINGAQSNASAPRSGAVYIFSKAGGKWTEQAYIKASNTQPDDHFGTAVKLSADGRTLAVSATGEDSAARGVDGDQSNNAANLSGAVYVFSRPENDWVQQAYIKASNSRAGWMFGTELALSADGGTLAVAAHSEGNSASGIDADQNGIATKLRSGAVYLFKRTQNTWAQKHYIKASNADAEDAFGYDVALSADGETLAVGARGEDSPGSGVNGNQTNSGPTVDSGAVYVFGYTQ